MRTRAAASLDVLRWPAIAKFFRGYLHQDAGDEHASIEEAFDMFWHDASVEERRAFATEWLALRRRLDGRAWIRVQPRLATLGLAWMPGHGAGLARLRRHIDRAIGA